MSQIGKRFLFPDMKERLPDHKRFVHATTHIDRYMFQLPGTGKRHVSLHVSPLLPAVPCSRVSTRMSGEKELSVIPTGQAPPTAGGKSPLPFDDFPSDKFSRDHGLEAQGRNFPVAIDLVRPL